MLQNIVRKVLLEADKSGSYKTTSKSDKDGNIIDLDTKIDPGVVLKNATIQGDEYKSKDGTPCSITGDSAISDSAVFSGSEVHNSALSNSNINFSTLRDCEVTQSTVKLRSNVTNCIVRETFLAGIDAKYSLFENTHVNFNYSNPTSANYAQGKLFFGKITTSKFYNCDLTFSHGMIAGSTLNKVDINDTGSDCTILLANVDDTKIYGKIVIKGDVKPVEIGYAVISGTCQIYGVKGKSPKVIGVTATQPVRVEGNAKVYENAWVSGVVKDNATVFGSAQVHGQATIAGDCKVGGTAVMKVGTYTKGVYMSGEHTGGDAAMPDEPGIIDKVVSTAKSFMGSSN